MTLITPDDLTAEGFAAEQFGPTAIADWVVYADAVIAHASNQVQRRIGVANYQNSALPAHVLDGMTRAELCYAAADLVRRRMVRLDVEKRVGMDKQRSLLADYERLRKQYTRCAEEAIASIQMELVTAVQGVQAPLEAVSLPAVGVVIS